MIPPLEKLHNYNPPTYYNQSDPYQYVPYQSPSYNPIEYRIPEPVIHEPIYSLLPYSQPKYIPYHQPEYTPLQFHYQPDSVQYYPPYTVPIEEPKRSTINKSPHQAFYHDPYPIFKEYHPAQIDPVPFNFTIGSYANLFAEPRTDFNFNHIKALDSSKDDPKNNYYPPKSTYQSPQKNNEVHILRSASPAIRSKSNLIGSSNKKNPLESINSTNDYIDKLLNPIGIFIATIDNI